MHDVHYPTVQLNRGQQHSVDHIESGRFGGVLSFRLVGGEDVTRRFVDALELCTIAVSLGEATTLIWPLANGAIRLSVGLEDLSDLEEDIRRALKRAARVSGELFTVADNCENSQSGTISER